MPKSKYPDIVSAVSALQPLCIICLSSNNTISLDCYFQDTQMQIREVVNKVLAKNVCPKQFYPKKVCLSCCKSLKIAYDLIMQFEGTEEVLKGFLDGNGIEIEENVVVKTNSSAVVELITPLGCYNLKDVRVIQPNKKKKDDFRGFLENLGKEISAEFVDKNVRTSNKKIIECQSVSVVPIGQRNKEDCDKKVFKSEEIETEKRNCDLTAEDLTCKKCSKRFTNKVSLKKHWNHMHTEPKHLCSHCGFLTRTESGLTYHINTKHYKKRVRCHICDKTVVTTTALRSHLQAHANTRHFLCNECGKTFNYAYTLENHIRSVHTNEKNIACEYCDKTFIRSSALKVHMRRHTGERTFKCGSCEKAYFKKSNLRAHLKSVHNVILPKVQTSVLLNENTKKNMNLIE